MIFDPGAALVDRFAGLTAHPLAPLLDRFEFALAAARPFALALSGGLFFVGRHRRVDLDASRGEVDDILLGGVVGVDQQPLWRLAEALLDLFEHWPGEASIIPSVAGLSCRNDAATGLNGQLNIVAGAHRTVGKPHHSGLWIGRADPDLALLGFIGLVRLGARGLLGAQLVQGAPRLGHTGRSAPPP